MVVDDGAQYRLTMGSRPLWTPDPDQAAQTNLARFAAEVGIDIAADGGFERLHRWSVDEPGRFWSAVWDFCGVVASQRGSAPMVGAEHMADVRFFDGARLNFAENLLKGDDDEIALVFADESGAYTETTRGQLRALVSRLAAAMRAEGVGPGDRVACWLPNVPEAYAVMLAAASVGAVFSSTSPDFGAAGVLDRFGQIEPKLLVAVDGYAYGGQRFDCTDRLAEIRAGLPSLAATVVLNRTGSDGPPKGAVDFDAWIEPHPAGPIPFEQLPFDHPLYVLYSSGTTGRPKCIVHRAGGILLKHLCEHQLHCDVRPGDRVFYFTTTGWMMWNWLASALASRAAAVVWDGNPVHPKPDTLFDMADQAGVTLFGTSARYIDSLRKAGVSPRQTHRLSTLRTICSTGSPLSPDGFDHVYNEVKADIHLASISGAPTCAAAWWRATPPARFGRARSSAPPWGSTSRCSAATARRSAQASSASWCARRRSRRSPSGSGARGAMSGTGPRTTSGSRADGTRATTSAPPSTAGT